MRMTEIEYDGRVPIDGYGPGFFRIEDTVIKSHILMSATGAVGWTGLDDTDAMLEHLQGMDVVFIGTGGDIKHLPETVSTVLKTAGIAFEIMATPAACRTYNVLLSEGRLVGAALLTV